MLQNKEELILIYGIHQQFESYNDLHIKIVGEAYLRLPSLNLCSYYDIYNLLISLSNCYAILRPFNTYALHLYHSL